MNGDGLEVKPMRVLSVIVLLTAVLTSSPAFGFGARGEDCANCHTLKKEEAAALLRELIPGAKVLDIRTSPMKGIWEVDIETGGRKAPFYMDFGKRFILQGTLVDIRAKRNLTRDRMVDLNRVDPSKIPLKDALVMGDRNARSKVVVFDDPD